MNALNPAPATLDPLTDTPEVVPLKKAVLYLRVSTPRQARKNNEAEGYSIPQQREYCHQKARGVGS